jgi:nitrite reductase (NO-forming)
MDPASSELENSLAHHLIAAFAILALVCALAAVGVAVSKEGNGVAANGAQATATEPIDFGAEPSAGWKPFDPKLKPAPGASEHAITLHAKELPVEVAPGLTQEMWTFNGQVPAPILRGHVGDVFTVTLRNEGKNGHSLDFHASEVAPDDEMRTIAPGESLVYQFEATHSGIWMYHCGTPPVLHHTGNGMYGAVIIDPPNLPPVDHEYIFVQSEIYVGGTTANGYTKMQNEQWDAVVFNGYANQYEKAPIRVEPGEHIRAWVLDAGPSENSSFHVIGTIFDTVYREGHYELRPDATHGGSQSLDLQPAQGGFVEFTLDERGLYPVLTHKLANAEKGAIGYFQAGDPREGSTSHAGH